MSKFQLNINDQNYEVEADPQMPLLWVLRDLLDLTGTKYGCGIGQCGACTIHVDQVPIRACCIPLRALKGKKIQTIEGLDAQHPVPRAWKAEDVPQCGYCQAGQIMTAVALLERKPNPSPEEIQRAMKGNLCRCGTYPRILKAIQRAAKTKQQV
ncbi:MAG: (2Fe-2S)-binding protein [Bacteroidota bacterium]